MPRARQVVVKKSTAVDTEDQVQHELEGSGLWLGSLSSYLGELEARERISAMTGTPQAGGFFDDDEGDSEPDPVFKDMSYMGQSLGNLAIITISGRLTNDNSWMNRFFGDVGYDDIRKALGMAVEADSIENILLVLDSPGGAVTGLDEVANLVKSIDAEHKPVYAHTGAMMLSGAYWLGSQAREITAAPFAEVGSIGVVAVHKDRTAQLKQMGVKATVMRAGKRKALGNPFESLTPEVTKILQERLDTVHERFLEVVAEGRGLGVEDLREHAGDGRQLFGSEAVGLGLVDDTKGLDEVVQDLIESSLAGDPGISFPGGPAAKGEQLMAGKKVVLSKEIQAKIAAGVPMEEALKGAPAASVEGAEPGDAGKDKDKGAPKTEGKTEASAGDAGKDADKGKDAGKDEGEDKGVKAPGNDSSGTEMLVAKLADALNEGAKHKAALDTLTEASEAQKGLVTALSGACRSALTRLDVALGSAERDNSHLEGAALVAAYAKSEGDLLARYPVGGSVKVEVEEEADPMAAAAADPLQRASRKVTTLR